MAHSPALLASWLGVLLVAACAGQTQPGGVAREAHAFDCCANVQGDTSWLSGQDVSLQWTVTHSQPVTYSRPAAMKLTLELRGPYDSVTALKSGKAAPVVAQAAQTVDDSSTPPVSILSLPAGLPPGYYNLIQKTDFGGGNSAGAGKVVRIGP